MIFATCDSMESELEISRTKSLPLHSPSIPLSPYELNPKEAIPLQLLRIKNRTHGPFHHHNIESAVPCSEIRVSQT